jgi:hypothetical protein
MATKRPPGITVDTEGFRSINKEHRGERIFARLGLVCKEQAERRLAQELECGGRIRSVTQSARAVQSCPR